VIHSVAKPPILKSGAEVRVISLSSPVDESKLRRGCDELQRLGYRPSLDRYALARDGFFAGSVENRTAALRDALGDSCGAIFCSRGGYGSNYLLEMPALQSISDAAQHETAGKARGPKILVGFSDITSLQIHLWQRFGWVTFYGPMVAAAMDAGSDQPGGYDSNSFRRALTETSAGWTLDLGGEAMLGGEAEGRIVGGCLTMVEATLGTRWELDTGGAILLLEDRAMKPYQVDRGLMHLKQAGKLAGVRGIILGDFPESEPQAGSESVHDVAKRVLKPLGIPVVWGVPVGHTARPMLTIPLGIRAHLSASGTGRLQLLEPACVKTPDERVRVRT
jgi:muramoyltetrapeptide carboxypeptidase